MRDCVCFCEREKRGNPATTSLLPKMFACVCVCLCVSVTKREARACERGGMETEKDNNKGGGGMTSKKRKNMRGFVCEGWWEGGRAARVEVCLSVCKRRWGGYNTKLIVNFSQTSRS